VKRWKVFGRIVGAAVILYSAAPWLMVHFGGSDELVEAQLSPIQLACAVGASPISSLITRNQTTGALLYNACVDINGNLFLNPASVPGKLGPQTFNVVSGANSAIATSRKISLSASYTNPGGLTGIHVMTVSSGTGFLSTDVGTTLDCYVGGVPAQAVNESTITSFTSSTSITFSGTTTGLGGNSVSVCVVGGLDATAAILAAENALAATGNPGLLYIPCGGYLINAPLSTVVLPLNSMIQGDGSSCVTFYLPGDFAWSTVNTELFSTSGGGSLMSQLGFDALGQTTNVAIQAVINTGGPAADLLGQNLVALSAVSACIAGSLDNSSNLYLIRATNLKCGGGSTSVVLNSHGGSLINPQINGNFSTLEGDMSIVGGYINGTAFINGFGAALNAIMITGTRITALNLASNAGAFVSGANVGPCGNGQACVGSEVGTGISIDATSRLNISNSNVSGGGSGKFAISNAGALISGGANNLFVTNSATIYGGGGTFRRSPGELCCAALVTGNFALTGNWGTSPALTSVQGFDSGFKLVITSGTGAPGANPGATLTFADGQWPSNGPSCTASRGDANAPVAATWTVGAANASFNGTFVGTPAVSTAYTLYVICAPIS
jgi:hypothetical protein